MELSLLWIGLPWHTHLCNWSTSSCHYPLTSVWLLWNNKWLPFMLHSLVLVHYILCIQLLTSSTLYVLYWIAQFLGYSYWHQFVGSTIYSNSITSLIPKPCMQVPGDMQQKSLAQKKPFSMLNYINACLLQTTSHLINDGIYGYVRVHFSFFCIWSLSFLYPGKKKQKIWPMSCQTCYNFSGSFSWTPLLWHMLA